MKGVAEVVATRLCSPVTRQEKGWLWYAHTHDDRDVFQASPDELPAIDIHSL